MIRLNVITDRECFFKSIVGLAFKVQLHSHFRYLANSLILDEDTKTGKCSFTNT